MTPLRILVTNDDGVLAPGIVALACALSEIATVTVVAPDRPRSAAGHAITLHKPLRMHPVTLREYTAHGITAWGTTGTPADCVILGMHEAFHGAPPDLVVSGINSGPNVGDDVTYSGTVAAAMEAVLMGLPAFSCSMGWFANHFYYADAARAVRSIVELWQANPPVGRTLWNLNLPNLPLEDYEGVSFTRLGHRTFKDIIEKRTDPKGQAYYWIAGDKFEEDLHEGTDTWAVKQNRISITPLDMDMTHSLHLEAAEQHYTAAQSALSGIVDWVSPGPDAGEIPYASAHAGDAED